MHLLKASSFCPQLGPGSLCSMMLLWWGLGPESSHPAAAGRARLGAEPPGFLPVSSGASQLMHLLRACEPVKVKADVCVCVAPHSLCTVGVAKAYSFLLQSLVNPVNAGTSEGFSWLVSRRPKVEGDARKGS